MKLKLGLVGRSLLLGFIILSIVLLPSVVRAIAPNASFFAQLPPILERIIPIAPSVPELTPDNLLPETNQSVFSRMPGGQDAPAPAPNRFVPRQERVTVNPTNYDRRMEVDIYGNPVNNAPIVVLHETVGSASSAINTFRNAYASDDDQVSYHSLIKRDGTIVYLVPPELRAYGAGNSVFASATGIETVKLDAVLPPSVNNFAYHTSLESPSDGRGNGARHSGYTAAQYRSLAWLVAQTGVPDNRLTTHRAVDRSGTRRDPRSFDSQQFTNLLRIARENIAQP
ncbi:MAG: peptidoglycan recognition family protein [Oculatellaceae cyanobacterium bins.114]|nr:peptidoglycan recognition family protein [Oculatellaceae cyanobacterium bins.114]